MEDIINTTTVEEVVNENNVPEEITEETTEQEQITDSNSDQAEVTNEFTELLEEYIKQQIEDKQNEEDPEEDPEQVILLDNEENLQNINNDLLSQILETELETKGEIVNQSIMMVDQAQNNTLNSSIETISLDNFLTLVLIASILFTSVLTFSRRIF